MAKRRSGRGGVLVAGLGLGVAAGVALGTLVLAPNIPSENNSAVEASAAAEPPTKQSPEAEEGHAPDQEGWSQPDDDAVAALGPALVAGSLEERPVLVVRTADSDESGTDRLAELAGQAGAVDAGRIVLTEKFFDRESADELRSLADNSLPAGAELSAKSTSSGMHAGELLAAALLLDPDSAEPQASTEDRQLVLTTLREAGFIEYEEGTIRPAQGVLLATGDSAEPPAAAEFAEALKAGGAATVVTGPRTSADDGVIAVLREEGSQVSTVDTAEQSWARVSAVLALAEQMGGGAGAYGLGDGADGTVPTPGDNDSGEEKH